MANSGINFKVYCISGENSEVKRFCVDSDAVTSFIFMKEKLKSVFPNLRDSDFKITWKDADGDYISITNDDDFITALTEMSDNPKVLYVNNEPRILSDDGARHFQVVCDICQKGISGYRYKCIECPDYDLCALCEGSGHHSEHMMLRLPNSATPIAKVDRKMMYNAARALKKSAFHVAKEAHRCARESYRTDKDKSHRNDTSGPSVQTSAHSCPFAVGDMGDLFNQNINPLIEMFAKGATNITSESNPISDLVRSVVEAFAAASTEQASTPETMEASNASPASEASSSTENKEEKGEAPTTNEKNQQEKVQSSTQPSAPLPPTTTTNNQEMEWTILSDGDEVASQASATSQTPATTQPPPPPQDPRLMRGLAQLYEMGFSNDNHFLNYMLETHNYNVGDVVKAILELK